MPQCDFCDSQRPTWRYPAKSFVVAMPDPLPNWGSDGDWAACETCHDLIERNMRETLLIRSYMTVPGRLMLEAMEVDLREKLRLLHKMFHENRTGPAVREE